jgi:hypothetical protein
MKSKKIISKGKIQLGKRQDSVDTYDTLDAELKNKPQPLSK